jgi:small GTP-binding protein
MASEIDDLRCRAEELASIATGRPEADRAQVLVDRLRAGRFVVAFVGEFKRGKSTLVNALLGEEIVPSGVLPLTAVATEIRYGQSAALVNFLDGTQRAIEVGQLAGYVTETANPRNELGVERVEVHGRWKLLESGVVFVDTPGIGSVYLHNTEAGQAALLEADGAVMVLSADAPLSEQERELLSVLAIRQSPTFFVLNKADHLSVDELEEVRAFIEEILSELFGRAESVFAVNARSALLAKLDGRARAGEQGVQFDAFASKFESFVVDDLVGARAATARTELQRLGNSLRDGIALEQAALNVEAVDLERLVQQFASEADRQRVAFGDDRTLLARDVARLLDEIGSRLVVFAPEASAKHAPDLAEVASTAPRRRLPDELRAAVEASVRASFEEFRISEASRVEAAWNEIAESFRARTEQRVDAARLAAADLFAVPLPHLAVATLSDRIDRFSYLFIQVEGVGEPLERLVGRFVPSRVARRRALAKAQDELAREFDKHAGRARWDLSERLDALRRDLVRKMGAELDHSIDAIDQAAVRAREWQRSSLGDRRLQLLTAERLDGVAAELIALGGEVR